MPSSSPTRDDSSPMPYRTIDRTDLIFQQLKVLNGIDDDRTRAYTRLINQIRSSLVGTYPECEHLLRGSIIHRRWILELLAHYGGPTKLCRLCRSRAIACAKKHKARNPAPIVDALCDAITSQQLTLPCTIEAELGVALAATDALAKLDHRKRIHQQVPEIPNIIDQIPLTQVLLSMPGIGPATAARILMTIGDFSDFATAARLASYAGLCPATNQSGTSLNSHSVNRAGNKKLNNALWAALFFSYQTPRALTTILRAQPPGRKAIQRSCGASSTQTPQRLVHDGHQSRHFLQ